MYGYLQERRGYCDEIKLRTSRVVFCLSIGLRLRLLIYSYYSVNKQRIKVD